jgi:hypothetical protein
VLLERQAPPAATALELANAGAYERALALLAQAPSMDVEARFLRAQVLLSLGDGGAARDELRACSFLQPEDMRFRRWLDLCAEPTPYGAR